MLRELPSPDEINRPNDNSPIVMLPPNGWYCTICPPYENDPIGTVTWIEGPDGREFGRCRQCGQKFVLADV